MAGRLLEAGHSLRVWNRTPGRDEALVAAGASRAATPAEAAQGAAVVITMVADPAALEQVLFGPDGAAETIAPDATLIDMSTVGPTAIRAAAEKLAPVAVLDAPVLGSVPHAQGGDARDPGGRRSGRPGPMRERSSERWGPCATWVASAPARR